MKKVIFLLLILPVMLTGQNYLFEITPTGGLFDVEVTNDPNEAYPRSKTDFGLLDTANFQLVAYQRIADAKSKEAQRMNEALKFYLSAEQTEAAFSAHVALDYDTYANSQWLATYDGAYLYTVRGTATNFNIVISQGELRRQSNNNPLASIQAQQSGWFTVTLLATSEKVDLYQFGNVWWGKNAAGKFVTLKKL